MTPREGMFIMGRCRILITKDPIEDFEDGAWHLSISTENALPSYKEMKEARYRLLPDDIYMAEIFPPQDEFVNLNPFVRHLFQIDIQKSNFIMTEPIKKTSNEWAMGHPDLKDNMIWDPDGWDRTNFHYAFYREEITLEEFNKRMLNSTIVSRHGQLSDH